MGWTVKKWRWFFYMGLVLHTLGCSAATWSKAQKSADEHRRRHCCDCERKK